MSFMGGLIGGGIGFILAVITHRLWCNNYEYQDIKQALKEADQLIEKWKKNRKKVSA